MMRIEPISTRALLAMMMLVLLAPPLVGLILA
jgi:hypothetical protein